MAEYNRRAKPLNLWTSADLAGFNIEVVSEKDIQSFFGVSELPTPPHISPVVWNNALAPAGPISKEEKTFFALLQDAMQSPAGDNAAPNDLALFLLGYLGYDDDPTRVLHTQKVTKLLICGKYVSATSDISLLDREGHHGQYLLLVQQDTYYSDESSETWAPLIAKAIAAFRHNSAQRRFRSPLKSQTFPAMTMLGTSVAFYKITITQALADAVMSGIFPEETTFVYEFQPSLNLRSPDAGMVTVENRRVLLKCFEAFKRLIVVPHCE
ncbi:hypothetical protein D9619_007441 [Psilocybe cf. subviscida]|uniref:Uncharacterized protein n=1 Tax=Psilocybe cf. subviscida TaxID=2480587 RepID=A0A8H5EWU2_9AGAR|nr:hypothetical protein D9619_007441 [Psilocybe cf. subviscida]